MKNKHIMDLNHCLRNGFVSYTVALMIVWISGGLDQTNATEMLFPSKAT